MASNRPNTANQSPLTERKGTFFKRYVAKRIFPVSMGLEYLTGFSDVLVLIRSSIGAYYASSLGIGVSALRLLYSYSISDYNEDVEDTIKKFKLFRDQFVARDFKKVTGYGIESKQEDILSRPANKLKNIYYAVDTIISKYEEDKNKNPARHIIIDLFNSLLVDGLSSIWQNILGLLQFFRTREQKTDEKGNEIPTPYFFHFTRKLKIYSLVLISPTPYYVVHSYHITIR